jgi:hypothetical protein
MQRKVEWPMGFGPSPKPRGNKRAAHATHCCSLATGEVVLPSGRCTAGLLADFVGFTSLADP